MASGVEMLLKQVLKSLGVTITPEEITKEFDNVRTMIPKFAGDAKAILTTTELRYAEICEHLTQIRHDVMVAKELAYTNEDKLGAIASLLHDIDLKLAGTDGILPAGQGAACEFSVEQINALLKGNPTNGG